MSNKMPRGIPFIIGNEAAERFSFYGMRAILVIFMTRYLLNQEGAPDFMSEEEALGYFHIFVSAVYVTPVIGAIISDALWGKYRTIIVLSTIYCVGHFILSMDNTRVGLFAGLGIIAIGSGGIKPCVSAHVGDQFSKSTAHLLPRVFSWFYFSVNLGAFASSLATPWLLEIYGAEVAFGVPGVLMVLATLIFWRGRSRFVNIRPGGMQFIREVFSGKGFRTLGKLSLLYFFIAGFWTLFDQSSSAWVLQAQKMDRVVFGVELLPAQIQAANPILVMALIPLFSYGVYPLLNRFFKITALRKIGIGFVLTAFSFVIIAVAQMKLDAGMRVHIFWQIIAYVVLTAGEVMVSITALEFSYTQAPKRMKSFIMSFFMLSVAMGNLFTSAVNFAINDSEGKSLLSGADYYWFFAAFMFVLSLLFLPVIKYYKETTHIHDIDPKDPLYMGD